VSKRDRYVLLMVLINELARRESWCGETHVQKATYLAQNLRNIPFNYDFLLYKHGPYSFELTDELTEMRADNLLVVRAQPYPYGPTLCPSDLGQSMMLGRTGLIERYQARLREVAEICGGKGVAELERVATAYFVTRETGADASIRERGVQVNKLKPHISEAEAMATLRNVDEMIARFGSNEVRRTAEEL
jgi:hypothetical protein